MILKAISLDFNREMGYVMPKDPNLHKLAIQFAETELAEMPNFSEYNRVWLACETDENDHPTSVHGALGFTWRPDFVLARFTDKRAFITLYNRANAYLSDNGCRGAEALVYVNPDEAPEQKCPDAEQSLAAIGARLANRWIVKVR